MKNEKNTNKDLNNKVPKKNLVDFLNGSFFAVPRSALGARKRMRRASSFIIQDYFFAYFSSETGQKIGYKHFFVQQISKELDLDRGVFREGFKEVEESGIFKIFDFEHKGKIVFLQNEFTKDLIDKLESNELFINIDMKLNISISNKKLDEKIIKFPTNEVEQITPEGGANPTTQVEQIAPEGGANPTTSKNTESFDWSTWEANLKTPQEAYIKEDLYKESYHKEVSSLAAKVDTQAIKNEMMNDDLYNKIEKKEEDKISNFYLSELIDLGLYDYKAKEYISKLSTDDIQKAFDKLEAAKDSGHYIKNEGNFIRETLEVMINPNFKPKYSIQEKDQIILNIPAPIKKTEITSREVAVNQALNLLIPNFNLVIHQESTKEAEVLKKLIGKYQYCIEETSTDYEDINQERQSFTEKIKTLKSNPDNQIKEMLFNDYSNPFLNKKNENGQRYYDLFLAWFEGV